MSVAEVCREHQISETLFYSWREKLLEGGAERLAGKEERTELVELRKRVLRVMRERRLIQRRTHEPRRRRPGFFKVERPGQLWHLDMTSIWVAEHGWVYLNATIDCCTREIAGWEISLRCRAAEAITVIERAVAEQGIPAGTLTLGTDNGSAFTARATRLVLSGLGVSHRRGGYRDPESQAFIESWFRYLKERCVWRNEFETLDQAHMFDPKCSPK